MNHLTESYLQKIVDDTIRENQDEILKYLSRNTDESMSTEQVCGTMIVNCLSLSAKLSVQIMTEFLTKADVLHLDEKAIAKLHLKRTSSDIEE